MKNYEASQITKSSFLFLAISLLMLADPFISNAQRVSSASNVEGTEWQVTTLEPYGSKTLEKAQAQVYAVYSFGTQGQATLTIIYIYATGLNPSMGPYDINTPKLTYHGTYRQNGNSIYLEFTDTPHKISATISGNQMQGELIDKADQKSSWAAKNISLNNDKPLSGTTSNSTGSSYSFSVPANHALLGVWKYVEYSGGIDSGGIKIPPSLSKIVTITFHEDGSLDILIQGGFVDKVAFLSQADKSNWNYLPKTVSSGVLEQYKGSEIVAKSNVRWINNKQLEITATFPRETKQGIIYTRERENPNDYRSLIKPENILPDPCCRNSVTVGDPVLVTDALSKSPYQNVIRGTDGKLKPAGGYEWVNPKDSNDFRVQLIPGLVKTEDGLRPAKGYRWVNPNNPEDFRVEPIP